MWQTSGCYDSLWSQQRIESEQKKAWEEQKKQRGYEGMFTDEIYAEYEASKEDDDDDGFM